MTTGKRRIPINNHESSAKPAVRPAGASREEPKADPRRKPHSTVAGTADVNDPAGVAGTAAVAEAPDMTADLAELTREHEALAESLLRLRADFENYRKRAARELVDARDRARGELLAELLPVLDNLERALDAAEHHDEGKVLGGVRLTRDLFVGLLQRSGVEEIETVGLPFDPRVHDAVIVQESDQDEGMVAAVLERGYRQGDRILRPAKVVVSAGRTESDWPTVNG